jgi:hypothetical protein
MPSIVVSNVPFIPVAPKLFIGATGAGVAIECAAQDIDISPDQDENTVETFCSVTTSYKPARWTITASCYQSYGATGLWTALSPMAGTVQQFAFVPDRAVAVSVDNPMMTGSAFVKAFAFYAAAVGTPNAIDVILAVRGAPTFAITGTLPTGTEAFDEQGNPIDEHAAVPA